MVTETQDRLDVAIALEKVIAWLREARDPLSVSASALSALSRLESSGPLRITELAEREGLTQPGMTTLINRLEEADLARRAADPADRRAVNVTITQGGIERVRLYRQSRTDLIGSRLDQLSDDDQRALIDALPALVHFAQAPIPTNTPQESRG